MRINIVLDFFPEVPNAQIELMYHLANCLRERDHHIVIYHLTDIQKTLKFRKWFDIFNQHIIGKIRKCDPTWIELNNNIECYEIAQISNNLIKDAHIIFYTSADIGPKILSLSSSKGKKFNLIQTPLNQALNSFELYKLPINYIVTNLDVKQVVDQNSPKPAELLLLEDQKLSKATIKLEDLFNSSMTYLERLQTIESKRFRNL
jgi:hypothetical protein